MGKKDIHHHDAPLLIRLSFRAKVGLMREAASHDLSALQPFALCALQPGASTKMNALLESLSCDPSHLTGIVDHLEAKGYITRHDCETDRRIKMIGLTARGAKVRAMLLQTYLDAYIAAFDEFDPADKKALRTLID